MYQWNATSPPATNKKRKLYNNTKGRLKEGATL